MQNRSDLELASAQSNSLTDGERLPSPLLEANRQQQTIGTIADRSKWAGEIPLSYAQERLWLLDQLGLVGAAYNSSTELRLEGDLNVEALEHSVAEVVRRHESLRTRFGVQDGVPHQLIDPPKPFKLHRADLSLIADPTQRNRQLRECIRLEQLHRFDLCEGPLFRVVLMRLDAREHVLLLTMHHIVSDGWSLGVLRGELAALYSAYSQGQSSPLPELPTQYADYAIWQRGWFQGEVLQRQVSYWRERLHGMAPQLDLPTDRPRPTIASFKGAELRFQLPVALSRALTELGLRERATLFMIALAVYQILLSRWSGQQDIVVGSPIAGRGKREVEGLIGFFVNTLVLRTEVSGHLTFRQLLERIRDEVTLEAYEHQDLPFAALVKELHPERDLARQPIFQVMLALQNYPEERLELPGLTCTWSRVERATTHFDLTLQLYRHSDGISGVFEYATDLFDEETIARMAGNFRTLLAGILGNPDRAICQLPMLDESEKQQLLLDWNATKAQYPNEKLIHELFERQVEKTPEAVAVVYEGRSLTYADLNRRANQLARYLRNRSIGPDELVALCIERSLEMVVGLLGIIKAGGAYVPLDPTNPAARLRYMLEDSAPRVVLTQEKLLTLLPAIQAEVIALDSRWLEIEKQPSKNLDSRTVGLVPHNLAYVIYTSGSTGQPKGVMIEHRNVLSLWHGLETVYRRSTCCQRIAVNASFNFDASVKQLVQLLSGRTLFPVPQEARQDPSVLLSFMSQHRIDAIDCTPGQLRSWLSAGLLESRGHRLRLALVGGETIDAKLWSSLAQCSDIEFCNVYGPTESTVDATVARLSGDTTAPHIGRPMENRRIYILDRHDMPVPIGVVGEICIGGAGVARGYLNRAELSAAQFLPDPFGEDGLARMYKTGDIGRWRADGAIEYIGRNDDQVKIRGYRIQLSEIEGQLVRHQQVQEAAVIANEDSIGEKRLVAYVTLRDQSTLNIEELRTRLKAVLPEYMVPSAFVILESFPLTPNGKLNTRALPIPDLAAYVSSQYEAPHGEIEAVVAEIWNELLRVHRIGRQDNFFELGGHSLLAMRVIARINEVLDVDLPLRVMFERPTVQALSNFILQEIAAEVSMEAP